MNDMRNYFKLAPHKQLKLGLLAVAVYGVCTPLIFALLMIVVSGASLGRPNEGFQSFTILILEIIAIIGTFFGILLPIIRLLITSHRFSKKIGRGDEHYFFYIGASLLLLTWILTYEDYTKTVTQNGATDVLPIILFFSGNIIGLLLLFLSIFLLIRLSKNCYYNV